MLFRSPPVKPDYNRKKIEDSINNVWRNGIILDLQKENDSLKKSAKTSQSIVTPLKKTVKYQQFQIDSMKKANVDCPVILAKATETIDTMNVVIEELGNEAENYSKALTNCEKQQVYKDAIIIDSKALNKQCDSLNVVERNNTTKAKKQTKSAVFWGNVKATIVAVLGIAGFILVK